MLQVTPAYFLIDEPNLAKKHCRANAPLGKGISWLNTYFVFAAECPQSSGSLSTCLCPSLLTPYGSSIITASCVCWLCIVCPSSVTVMDSPLSLYFLLTSTKSIQSKLTCHIVNIILS